MSPKILPRPRYRSRVSAWFLVPTTPIPLPADATAAAVFNFAVDVFEAPIVESRNVRSSSRCQELLAAISVPSDIPLSDVMYKYVHTRVLHPANDANPSCETVTDGNRIGYSTESITILANWYKAWVSSERVQEREIEAYSNILSINYSSQKNRAHFHNCNAGMNYN